MKCEYNAGSGGEEGLFETYSRPVAVESATERAALFGASTSMAPRLILSTRCECVSSAMPPLMSISRGFACGTTGACNVGAVQLSSRHCREIFWGHALARTGNFRPGLSFWCMADSSTRRRHLDHQLPEAAGLTISSCRPPTVCGASRSCLSMQLPIRLPPRDSCSRAWPASPRPPPAMRTRR